MRITLYNVQWRLDGVQRDIRSSDIFVLIDDGQIETPLLGWIHSSDTFNSFRAAFNTLSGKHLPFQFVALRTSALLTYVRYSDVEMVSMNDDGSVWSTVHRPISRSRRSKHRKSPKSLNMARLYVYFRLRKAHCLCKSDENRVYVWD